MRPRSKKSTISYGGYGLTPWEDEKLEKKVKATGLSAKTVVRAYLRFWIQQEGNALPDVKVEE